MDYLTTIGSVALMHLLMISSPGPTFFVVSRYALAGDRTSGLRVTLGVVLATLTWSAFAATGLGAVAQKYPFAFSLIQYAGAAYLIYLGLKLLVGLVKSRWQAANDNDLAPAPAGGWRAVGAGYLTNISNPKVIAYYTSLFGVMLPPQPSTLEFSLVVVTVVTISALWWSAVACFFTVEPVRLWFVSARRKIDAVMGVLLIGFGARLLLQK